MSIAAKLWIEEKWGDCETCECKDVLIKRWGRKNEHGQRKFICAGCAEKDDLIFEAMKEMFLEANK
jgi:hypothetical protein